MSNWPPYALERYLENQSGVADWFGPWVECSRTGLLSFQVSWSAQPGTVGVLGVQAQQHATMPVITLPTLTTGVYGAWPDVGATASSAAVMLENPFARMRLFYLSGGGGAADQFQAWRELRP